MPAWLKDIFIISLKGFESSFLNSLKILVGILFGPIAVFVFIELIMLLCPLVLLEKETLCYCFQGQDMKDEIFCFDNVIFSAILVKKILKWLEISLALVINWLSIRRLEIDSSDLLSMFIMVCHTSFRGFFVVSKV